MDNSKRPLNPIFVLNQSRYQGASVLLARKNFGCGRVANMRLGADAIRLSRNPGTFVGRYFLQQPLQDGLLPIVASEQEVARLFEADQTNPGYQLTIDLARQVVVEPDGRELRVRHRALPQALPANA